MSFFKEKIFVSLRNKIYRDQTQKYCFSYVYISLSAKNSSTRNRLSQF